MIKNTKFLVAIWLFCIFGMISSSYGKEKELSKYQGTAKITAIHAYLIYDHTQSFSEDILSVKDIPLWNTIIGEGYAGAPSHSTFVVVEISGRDISSTRDAKVNIITTDFKKAQIANVTRMFSMYGEYKKSYVSFVVPETGCSPITISAKLVGAGFDPNSLSKTIPFKCGE